MYRPSVRERGTEVILGHDPMNDMLNNVSLKKVYLLASIGKSVLC